MMVMIKHILEIKRASCKYMLGVWCFHDNYADHNGLSIQREEFSGRWSPIKSQPFDLKVFKNYTQLKNYNTTRYANFDCK